MAKYVVKDSMKCVLDLYFVRDDFNCFMALLDTHIPNDINDIPHTAALIKYVCYGRLAISKNN